MQRSENKQDPRNEHGDKRQMSEVTGTFRYVRHGDVESYVSRGWVITPALHDTHHGEHAELMFWPNKDKESDEPTKYLKASSCMFTTQDGGPRLFVVDTDGGKHSIKLNPSQVLMLAKYMVAYISDKIWDSFIDSHPDRAA